jgi:hypothetical protein
MRPIAVALASFVFGAIVALIATFYFLRLNTLPEQYGTAAAEQAADVLELLAQTRLGDTAALMPCKRIASTARSAQLVFLSTVTPKLRTVSN